MNTLGRIGSRRSGVSGIADLLTGAEARGAWIRIHDFVLVEF
jgi:hypothetical protein